MYHKGHKGQTKSMLLPTSSLVCRWVHWVTYQNVVTQSCVWWLQGSYITTKRIPKWWWLMQLFHLSSFHNLEAASLKSLPYFYNFFYWLYSLRDLKCWLMNLVMLVRHLSYVYFLCFLGLTRLSLAPRKECFYLEGISTLHSTFTSSYWILSVSSYVMFSKP